MLRDERLNVASTWADEDGERRREGHVEMRHGAPTDKRRDLRGDAQRDPRGGAQSVHTVQPHREIDRELRRIAKQRAGLDGQEAPCLREAERHQIWRKLGFSTALGAMARPVTSRHGRRIASRCTNARTAVVRGKKAGGGGSSCGRPISRSPSATP